MILGTGIDIVEVSRIDHSFQKFGERFLKRVLLPGEIDYCLRQRTPGPFLAGRFAAKEAISKAFGTGIGPELGWRDMEIAHKNSGEPFVVLHARGLNLLERRQALKIHVNISHTARHAVAVAVLEGKTTASS